MFGKDVSRYWFRNVKYDYHTKLYQNTFCGLGKKLSHR